MRNRCNAFLQALDGPFEARHAAGLYRSSRFPMVAHEIGMPLSQSGPICNASAPRFRQVRLELARPAVLREPIRRFLSDAPNPERTAASWHRSTLRPDSLR